jgi:hypothetical protein
MVDDEIIYEASVAVKCLSAHACPRTNEVGRSQFRHVFPGATQEE